MRWPPAPPPAVPAQRPGHKRYAARFKTPFRPGSRAEILCPLRGLRPRGPCLRPLRRLRPCPRAAAPPVARVPAAPPGFFVPGVQKRGGSLRPRQWAAAPALAPQPGPVGGALLCGRVRPPAGRRASPSLRSACPPRSSVCPRAPPCRSRRGPRWGPRRLGPSGRPSLLRPGGSRAAARASGPLLAAIPAARPAPAFYEDKKRESSCPNGQLLSLYTACLMVQ